MKVVKLFWPEDEFLVLTLFLRCKNDIDMTKALRKTEFSKFFIFARFWIVRFSKFRIFFGKTWYFRIYQKKFRNKFGSNTSVIGSKNPVFEAKIGVLGSKTGVSEYSEFTDYSEFVLFQIFQKLQKKLRQNWIFIFAKNSFWLEFELEYSISSSECRALDMTTF